MIVVRCRHCRSRISPHLSKSGHWLEIVCFSKQCIIGESYLRIMHTVEYGKVRSCGRDDDLDVYVYGIVCCCGERIASLFVPTEISHPSLSASHNISFCYPCSFFRTAPPVHPPFILLKTSAHAVCPFPSVSTSESAVVIPRIASAAFSSIFSTVSKLAYHSPRS